MRGGENNFSQVVSVVIQDIKKQMQLNDTDDFDYELSINGLVDGDVSYNEQVKTLRLLEKKNILRTDSAITNEERLGTRVNPYAIETPEPRVKIKVNQQKLEEYISALDSNVSSDKKIQPQVYQCELRLTGINLQLKINYSSWHTISQLKRELFSQHLFKALFAARGDSVSYSDIAEFTSKKNLRQVFSDNGYKHLMPFIESSTPDKLALKTEAQLSRAELDSMLTKINETYQKAIEEELSNNNLI